MAGQVNLEGAWSTVNSSISSLFGSSFEPILGGIGVVIIIAAFGKWLWEKKKGGGANSQTLLWSVAVGAFLAAPTTLIPLVLWIFDELADLVVTIWTSFKK